jgi:hypothetical protein
MRLALPKLYSFEYKAETALAAFSQPNKSKTIKIFTEINNFENH